MKPSTAGYGRCVEDLEALLRYYALSHKLVSKAGICELADKVLEDLEPGDLLAQEVKAREVLNIR